MDEAAANVIHERLAPLGADGGVIVLGPDGDYAMEFNSAGMFRGIRNASERAVAIYGE